MNERAALASLAHRELQREIHEAATLLAAAGFTEMPQMRPDARVGHRAVGDYYDLVLQFADGHMEAVRQRLPGDEPAIATQLWFPDRGIRDEDDDPLWTMIGDPLEVVHALLLLPTS